MWLDFLALLVLGLFTGMGAVRGGLASFLSLFSLGAAYAAAIWAAPRFGESAAEALGVSPWLGMPVAGSLAFLVTVLVMAGVSRGLKRLDRSGRDAPRSPRDRFAGAIFGAVRGGLLVLLLSYLALWVDALRATGTVDGLPEVGGSTAAAVTGSLVEAGVGAALGENEGARVMAHVAGRPGPAMADLQAIMEHPAIDELRNDPMFWSYVEHNSVDAAMNRASFQHLSRDEGLRRRLAELGLVDEAAAADPRAFRLAAGAVLRQVGPRIRGLREDPALQELMQDPEVVEAVQNGDHLALMSHPGFRAVVARVMEGGD